MRSKRLRRIEDLRRAIDCLPERTKAAMLDGISESTIIVGAYTDRRGGVCPMLAAHRRGGRTDLLAFAHAWDRFCEARRPRPASGRELSVLKAHLDASLYDSGRTELASAIADHQATARGRRAAEAGELGLGWIADEAPGPRERPEPRERELV
jgi:hypothetical protein